MRRAAIALTLLSAMLAPVAARAAAPANDNRADATVISTLPFADSLDISDASIEIDEPRGCATQARTVWYRISVASQVKVTIDTAGSGFDTVVALWKEPIHATDEPLACDDDDPQDRDVRTSRLLTTLVPGQSYLIQAGGWVAEAGVLELHVYESATIAGHVQNADGDPVPACVVAYDDPGTPLGWGFAESNASGEYEVEGLPAGSYIVVFYDCATGMYAEQYYDGKRTEASADRVALDDDSHATGIDATMQRFADLDLPDLSVDSVDVEHERLVAGDSTTGLGRTLTVAVANDGRAGSDDFNIQVRACPKYGQCTIVAVEPLDIPAGGSQTKTYHWNGAGQAGAVAYFVTVCGGVEYRYDNNVRSARDYEIADTPAGVGAGRPGYAFLIGDNDLEPRGCYDGHDPYLYVPRIQHF